MIKKGNEFFLCYGYVKLGIESFVIALTVRIPSVSVKSM